MIAAPLQAAELVAGFEGFRAKPYRCPAGVWTVGFGSTRDATGAPVTARTPAVTREGATALLRRDLEAFAASVALLVRVPLTEPQRAALCSFAYNVGAKAFGTSTLLKKLNTGDYAGAAAEFDRWNKSGGEVLRGLVARRAVERRLFETGLKA